MMPWVLTKNARLPASKPWQKQSKKKGTLKNRAREKVRRQQYEAENKGTIDARKKDTTRLRKLKNTRKQNKNTKVKKIPVCKYEVKLYNKGQDEKSMTHQNNLNQMNQQERGTNP